MQDNKAKIIEKLQKLFALSKSTNQHEAEAALAKANKLMEEYEIGMTDVDLAEDGQITEEKYTYEGTAYKKYVHNLAGIVGKLYAVTVLHITYKRKRGYHVPKGVHIRFIGTPTDVMVAKQTFEYLYNSWKHIVKIDASNFSKIHLKKFKSSHLYGYAESIDNRVEILLAERTKNVKSATGRDLVPVKNKAVDEYIAKNIKLRNPTTTKVSVNPDAYYQGQNRGNSIPLNAITQDEQQLRIGA